MVVFESCTDSMYHVNGKTDNILQYVYVNGKTDNINTVCTC